MEARLEIEPGLARLAALRASNGDSTTEASCRRKPSSIADGDSDSRELWDGAFHRAIAEAAGNSLLFAFVDVVDRIRQDPTWRRLREQARAPASQRGYVSNIIASLQPSRLATQERPNRRCAIISKRSAPAFFGS